MAALKEDCAKILLSPKTKKRPPNGGRPKISFLLAAALLKLKRLAVGTRNNSRIILMSTHLDPIKAAIIVAAAVMLAVIYSAFNGSVSKFGSHNFVLLS